MSFFFISLSPTHPPTHLYSDEAEDDPGSSKIQARTASLLSHKQAQPSSMITWGKEDGGHLYNPPSQRREEQLKARVESEEESHLWSLTVLQLREQLREQALPVRPFTHPPI